MIKLQDLFRESSGTWTSKWKIKLFQFNSNSPLDRGSSSSSSNYGTSPSSAPTAHKSTASAIIREDGKSGSMVSDLDGAHRDHNVTGFYPVATDAAPSTGPHSNSDNNSNNNKHHHHHQDGLRRKRKSSFRDLFWRIRDSGEQNILLDVRTEHLFEALKQAQQVGCMTERFSYLITSLDLHTIDLEDFRYSRTRMTAFSILQVAKSLPPEAPSPPEDGASTSGMGGDPGAQLFDERYLEKLGVHVIHNLENLENPTLSSSSSPSKRPSKTFHSSLGKGDTLLARQQHHNGFRVTSGGTNSSNSKAPSSTVEPEQPLPAITLEPPDDGSYKDWTKREQLISSPASMGLLPSVDRDNEYKLFEFFIDQQERNLSHVRLSTASAILHDSLILFMLGLNELDPSAGNFVAPLQQAIACSLSSQPWLHGSSMVNYMRQISFTGLTGPISFDQRGLRTDFKLNMMGMAPDIGLVKVGEWFSGSGGVVRHSINDPAAAASETVLNPLRNSQFTDGPNQQPLTKAAAVLNSDNSNSNGASGSVSGSLTYEDQSRSYELELRRYKKLLADGAEISVPYTKLFHRHGNLMVNEIIYERLYREQEDQVDILIVTTKISHPYFMLKETPNKLTGNDQYEGFAVDLIHELSKLVNFKYRWREVADKKYGSKEILANGTIQWNGMIGELLRGQADLAIVDLTITAQREEAVDFTLPFMNTGISILFKKPTTKVTTLFSFLSPFSSDVWAYVLAAYCGISAILFLVGHLSPYEWADPHPCRHSSSTTNEPNDDDNNNNGGYNYNYNDNSNYNYNNQDDDEDDETLAPKKRPPVLLKNQFSLLNSFWFTIGSLMQQGSDLTPRSMSTRTIAGIWYFFTLIMISSYTANLAAFLTVEKVVYPIENVRDLSNQQEIKYGCVESGSTCTFFHDSQIDTYKHINDQMRKFRTYVKSNEDGQKRVEEGKFAFFMESASIEYIVERNCNLTQIGGLLDSKGYGLATSKKSRLRRPYRTLLSEGILHLQETGMLHMLKNRWWKERRGGGTCTDDGKGGGVTELSLANVGGVFVVLLGGLGISFLVAIAEFMWRARRSGSTRDRMCEEMMSDLKFALACKRSMKPVKPASSRQLRQRQQQQQRQQQAQNSKKPGGSGGSGVRSRRQPDNGSDNNEFQWSQQQQHYYDHQATLAHMLEPSRMRMAADASNRQQQQQQQANKVNSKPCDPILLHAMLTMLMQQQQQQQPGDELVIGNDATGSEQVVGRGQAYSNQEGKYHHPLRQLVGAASVAAAAAAAAATLATPSAAAATSDAGLECRNDNYLGQRQRLQHEARQQQQQQQNPLFVDNNNSNNNSSLDNTLSGGPMEGLLKRHYPGLRMTNGINSSSRQQHDSCPRLAGGPGARWSSSSKATTTTTNKSKRSELVAAAAEKRRLLLFAQQTIDTADDGSFLQGQRQQQQ